MSTPTIPDHFYRATRQMGLDCTDYMVGQLATYVQRLIEANQKTNLTAITEPEAVWERHIVDSLTLCPLLGEGMKLADVGSGGGLPGLPLAISRPDLSITLIEATKKKAQFLLATSEALGLDNISVCALRAEEAGQDPSYREHFDIVTGRALSALPVFLELTLPLARTGGRVLAMKGAKADEELVRAERAMKLLGGRLVEKHKPGEGDESCILIIEKTRPTDPAYPRLSGTPKKKPLM